MRRSAVTLGLAAVVAGCLTAAAAPAAAGAPAAALSATGTGSPRHLAVTAGKTSPKDTLPPDPTSNTPLPSAFWQDCSGAPTGDPECDAAALSAFDTARSAEGLAPMTLPTGFDALSAAEQLMVLANIDRVDHGLTPIVGMSSTLDGYATTGANTNNDPAFPSWTREGGSNWASPTSPLISEFLWVYDDGLGSGNLDCTSSDKSGCWGHRHNVLYPWAAPALMGAAQTTSDAELFLGDDTTDSADAATWASLAGAFPAGLSASSLTLTGSSRSTTMKVWASGEPMNVTAAITNGAPDWTVSPRSCDLAGGHECTLTVSYVGPGTSPTGTLTVTGPNGSQAVPLAADDLTSLAMTVPGSLTGGAGGTIAAAVTDALTQAPLAADSATLQHHPASGGTWTTVATKPTDSTGAVSFSIRPSVSMVYRVTVGPTGDHASAASSPATVDVIPVLTLSAASGSGSHRHLTVHLAPAPAGTVCRIQTEQHGVWKGVTSARLGPKGNQTMRVVVPRGTHRFRAVTPGAKSKVLTLTAR